MAENQGYFASREAKDTASVMLTRARTFFNRLESNHHLDKIRNMWRAWHGFYANDNHQISFTGEQGELVDIPVNHFRNIGEHIVRMITSNRPAMDARAVNTDYKSLAQTHLANGILDYYMREKGLEDCLMRACEMAVVLGTGYVKMEWNATAGDEYDVDPETGELNYTGELEFSNPSFLDVVVDGSKESWNNDWVLVRKFQNKYNLAAKYPEYAEKIEKLQTKQNESIKTLTVFTNDETEDVPVYEFFHKKTEAMPEGRYILFLDEDIILLDTPIPYKEIPVYRIVPAEILGTPYGYTPMFDVYPLQEAINATYSAIITNQNAFAVQNVFVPRGADINVSSIEGGLNLIEGNAKPEALNLTQTPAEVFNMLQRLVADAETLSGVSSVTRGNPEASLKSGAALALVQSMSLQFISGLQRSYVKLIEDVGTGLLNILKDYAHTPKLVALVGRHNRPLLKEFTGDMIDSINRVIVDIGNPLSRSIAGRVQMAEQLAQMSLLKNADQYFQIINTGRLDAAYEGELSQLMCIKQENESLLNGVKPQALFLDKHLMHIQEHSTVIADPELRKNQELVANVAAHIQEHIDFLRTVNPDLLQMIGEQPLNPPEAAGMQGLPPGPVASSSVEGSPASDIAMPMDQQPITNGKQVAQMPQPARPPEPFQDLPTNPQDLI